MRHCTGPFYQKPWLFMRANIPEFDMSRTYEKGQTIIEWSESSSMFDEFKNEEPRMKKMALIRANTESEIYTLMFWKMETLLVN